MKVATIKPVKGKKIRKPDGVFLSEAGEPLEVNAYWIRREQDGDVTITRATSKQSKK